jgi:hypothetical protein
LALLAVVWQHFDPGAILDCATGAAGANNARSVDIQLTKEDLADIDREFTPPTSKKSLPMLWLASSRLETLASN